MKDLKVRVWDKINEKYSNPKITLSIDKLGHITSKVLSEYKIELFTGEFDSNGKDIYEGDIILSIHRQIYEVIWDKKNAQFSLQLIGFIQEDEKNMFIRFKGYTRPVPLTLNKVFYQEIIGNINETNLDNLKL